jgi:hypothetical protein
MMRDAESHAELGDGARLRRALGPQAVIDGRRFEARPAAPPARPILRHQEQRGRIRAAGDGEEKGVRFGERGEGGVDRRLRGDRPAGQQCDFCISRSASFFTAGEAVG